MPLNVDKISTGSLSVNGTEITENGGLPKYKVYTAKLKMSDGSATVFENTLGVNLTWVNTGLGIISTYNNGTLVGQNNIYISVTSIVNGVAPKIVSGIFLDNPWGVLIRQTDNAGIADSSEFVYVEIRVYN